MTAASAHPDMVPRLVPFDAAPYGEIPSHGFVLDLMIDRGGLSTIVEHVANTEHVRWLDRAAELHTDALGFTRRWLLDRGIMWFVARHEIDYRAEVRPGDELVVATWVRDVARTKSWRDYLIVRPRDERTVCRAATLWVLVSLDSRRPVRIPEEIRTRIAPPRTITPDTPWPVCPVRGDARPPAPGDARPPMLGDDASCTSP